MHQYARVIDAISRLGVALASVALAAMGLLTVVNVITRRFDFPINGAYSISVLLAVLAISFAIVRAQVEGEHIEIQLVTGKIPEGLQSVLRWISGLAGVTVWAFASWAAFRYAVKSAHRNELMDPLDIPVYPFRFIWGFALVLLCLAIIVVVYQSFTERKPPVSPGASSVKPEE
jgi:TRAP-type C4-dicarboxylate transport system permease small subunit